MVTRNGFCPSVPTSREPMTVHLRFLGVAIVVTAAFAAARHDVVTSLQAQSTDPCVSVTTRSTRSARTTQLLRSPKTGPFEHDDRWRQLDTLWTHRAAVTQRRIATAPSARQTAQTVGEIAVLQDTGDLVARPNPMDLADVGVLFAPNSVGGYDVSRIAYRFREPLGTAVPMADDDTRETVLPFPFAYFGKSYDRVFVNSDGNLTFGQGDTATSDRSVSRFLTGSPRIAPFFADLDPSAGGSILTNSDNSAFTVTWCAVPAFDDAATVTVQVSLLPAGAIEVHVSGRTTIRAAVVGVSPGDTTEFAPIDLSLDRVQSGTAAVGEQFTPSPEIDLVATSRKFLRTYADQFDNLIVFTDTRLLTDAFAYEVSVANAIAGIHVASFDHTREFGSGGALQSVCFMDSLDKYPDDPFQKFRGENSTVSIMGQEVGHRWLAFFQFRDVNGGRSNALLGRDRAHWSFFVDSDASVEEGNDIVDLGDGSFRTVAAVQRYSLLDQYAMGLVDQSEVPPFFYVENPTNIMPGRRNASSRPEVGVTFSGTKRTVTVDDIIAVEGPRTPSAAESPRVYRQAFVYIASAGSTIDPAAIAKLDRIRVAWDQFFSRATDSRMRAETRISLAAASTP